MDLTVLLSHTHTFTTFPETATIGCAIQIAILSSLLLRPQMFICYGKKKPQNKNILWRLGKFTKCFDYKPVSDYCVLFQCPDADSDKSNVLSSFRNGLNLIVATD